jgi:hypothetical protein
MSETYATGNTEIVRLCNSTSHYIFGLAASALAIDYSSAAEQFMIADKTYESDVELFRMVAGPRAEAILNDPQFDIQGFITVAQKCSDITLTKCDPGKIAERAVFASSALKGACVDDFKGES